MSKPGDLDTTFGTGGRVTTDFSNNNDQGWSVAIQTDGKIILGGYAYVGTNWNFALARYNINGTLDTNFGIGGRVTTDFSNNSDYGYSVALQTDGKIILGGQSYVGTNDNFALARYDTSGNLDATFGVGGRVTTDFNNNTDRGYSVAIQQDGKIILGGYAYVGTNWNFALARYNSDGSLDTNFGIGGRVNTDFSNNTDLGYSLALQTDGKIILGGYAVVGTSQNNFALARYNSNGSLDTNFGVGGTVTTDFVNWFDEIKTIRILLDGKIIVGGYTSVNPLPNNFALARYNSDGSLDTTFGTGGKVITDFANSTDIGFSVAIQTDGKIILGGYAYVSTNDNFALARYHENGSLDTTFGSSGRVITDFSNNNDRGYSVALQTDGKIILGGYARVGANDNFALARYINNTFIPSKPISYYLNLNYTPQQIKDLNEYDASYFKALNYTIPQLKAINFTDVEIKVGYSIADFKAVGYTDAQLKAIGFLAAEFKAANYTILQLKAINFTDVEIKVGGYSVAEFKALFYSDAELKAIGFTDADIKFAYIITETTEQLTFDDSKAITLFTNQDENTGTINVTNKNYKYFNLVNNSYDAYSILYIRSNGWLSFYNASESSYGQNKQQPTNSLRFFSFDAESTIKYYFDSNDNLMISTVGGFWTNKNDTSFNIIIKIEPNGKITVNYKSIGPGTYKPIIGWVGTNSSLTTDDTFYSTFDGIQAFNQSNINGKTLVFNLTNSIQFPISNICFVENSIVSTDQGLIEIQNIKEDYHSINNNKIICLTKTVTEEPYLICIEKDAIYKNVPSQKTLLSYNHKIFYNNNMISASELLDKGLNVSKVRYTGEVLYNLLFNSYEKMLVNGLVCETLHPQNRVAHLYQLLKEQPKEYYHYIIHNYNKKYANSTKKQ
jgi:uncharacterized delta-60 repeat protein